MSSQSQTALTAPTTDGPRVGDRTLPVMLRYSVTCQRSFDALVFVCNRLNAGFWIGNRAAPGRTLQCLAKRRK